MLLQRGNGLFPSHLDEQSAGGKISREPAYVLAGTNIEKILGLGDVADGGLGDHVAFNGGSGLEFSRRW